MRRQDSCSSDMQLDSAASASARHGDPNAKTVGCMSGIVCFLSTYHRTAFRKRKFLTFGKKQNQEKNNGRVVIGSSSPGSSSTTIFQAASSNGTITKIGNKSPSSCFNYLQAVSTDFVPRSPTLPAEIRRQSATPLVIARLMGLEEAEAPPSKQVQDQYYYSRITGQKRQQLLGALEKCDRDLKALKKMIEAVGAPPKRSFKTIDDIAVSNNGIKQRSFGGAILKKKIRSHELLRSSVSVLDDESSTRSPFSNDDDDHHHYNMKQVSFKHHYGRAQQRKRPAGEEDYYLSNPFIIKRSTTERSVTAFDEKKTHPDYNVIVEESTVDQVCRDIAWGEKREMGRIGLALQDHIYKNMIQELVAELDCSKHTSPLRSLRFEACRRRLSF